jgi:hypothetical protein
MAKHLLHHVGGLTSQITADILFDTPDLGYKQAHLGKASRVTKNKQCNRDSEAVFVFDTRDRTLKY